MENIVRLSELSAESEPNPRRKLTKTVVDRASFDPDGPSWQVIWDTEISGFGLRLREKSKTYILIYRNSVAKRRQLTIGNTLKLTPKQARDIAQQRRAEIELGADPSKERQDARHQPATEFASLARLFIDEYAKLKRKSWRTDERRLLPDGEAPICSLHGVDLQSSTVEDIEKAIERIHQLQSRDTPVEANRVAQTVNRVLNWSVQRRLVGREFHNILEFIDLNEESTVEAFIRPSELTHFVTVLDTLSLQWRAAVWLSLLTGARLKSEILRMRWQDVHLQAGEYVFPETKTANRIACPFRRRFAISSRHYREPETGSSHPG